ncbi:MAG: O-antigen ligase family protein [Chlorobium sp.]|nr:O-antigen ligase family protein [Chlorobium sp.]
MRIYLLWLIVSILGCYSLKDWFKPVPFLILMMPIYGNPDFPSGALGIQGLNPWNILLLITILSYLLQKNQDASIWDMDNGVTLLLLFYVGIIIISTSRSLFDIQTLRDYGNTETSGQIFNEYLVNSIKFLIPAYMVFTGARTESRRKLILWAIIISHLYIAYVVIKGIPISAVVDEKLLTRLGLKILEKTFSWSKVNTAMLLSGGAWAILFATPYLIKKKHKLASFISIILFILTSFSLALTGGRMGYVVWIILALLFSLMRWKKGLLLLPLLAATVISILPSVNDRFFQGISTDNSDITIEDSYQMTSGRTDAWPVVIDRIGRSPLIGYGALSMIRTGARTEVNEKLNVTEGERGFPHPHNAYLWLLLDTGILGTVPILLFWMIVLYRSKKLCGTAGSESDAIGVTSLTTSLAFLLAGIGSQNFYPTHGAIAMWAAIALAFRLYTDREKNFKTILISRLPSCSSAPLHMNVEKTRLND